MKQQTWHQTINKPWPATWCSSLPMSVPVRNNTHLLQVEHNATPFSFYTLYLLSMIIHMRTAGNLTFPWDRLQAAALIFGHVLIVAFYDDCGIPCTFLVMATKGRQKHSLDIL
jgi:BarA-like signal transduction histidine kinase